MHMISQHSLHDELLERLRTMIIAGQFSPGDKIPERQLCEQFDISRTPLREALKVLAAEGLVQLAPNRGAIVVELSTDEIEECVPISSAIQSLSARLACKNITDTQIGEIRALYEQMVSCHERRDRAGVFANSRLIHERIVAATGNQLLAKIYDALFFRIGWTRLVSHLSSAKIEAYMDLQKNMIAALEARQAQRLAELSMDCIGIVFDADIRTDVRLCG